VGGGRGGGGGGDDGDEDDGDKLINIDGAANSTPA
jgi:hypothetical protein